MILPPASIWIYSDESTVLQKVVEKAQSLFGEKHHSKCAHHTHPDLLYFQPASKTNWYTIEQIKEICEKSQLFPHEAPAQIFVLKRADRMQEAASNALLKTLEEPTKKTHFILLVKDLESVLPTIRSRAQIVSFETQEPKEICALWKPLEETLQNWPALSYNQLHLACTELQSTYEKGADESQESSLDSAAQLQALLKQIEAWFYTLDEAKRGSRKSFQKALSQVQLGLERSMKLSTCLEYLFLKLESALS